MDRALFKKGDICFVMHRDSWLSKAIAWFMSKSWTKSSSWSHTNFIMHVTDERVYVFESMDAQAGIGWVERYMNNPSVSMEIWSLDVMTDQDREAMVQAALPKYDAWYGFLQLISLAVRGIAKKLGGHVRNFIRQGWVCDELVLDSLKATSVKEFQKIDSKNYDTEDVYELVTSHPSARKVLSK